MKNNTYNSLAQLRRAYRSGPLNALYDVMIIEDDRCFVMHEGERSWDYVYEANVYMLLGELLDLAGIPWSRDAE